MKQSEADRLMKGFYTSGRSHIVAQPNPFIGVDAIRVPTDRWDSAPDTISLWRVPIPKSGDGSTPRYLGGFGTVDFRVEREPDHQKSWEAYAYFGEGETHEWDSTYQSYRHAKAKHTVASTHGHGDPQAALDALVAKLGALRDALGIIP